MIFTTKPNQLADEVDKSIISSFLTNFLYSYNIALIVCILIQLAGEILLNLRCHSSCVAAPLSALHATKSVSGRLKFNISKNFKKKIFYN